MATRQSDKTELTRIVGAISKLAGTVVGTAVVTGKRVVKNVTPSSGASSELGKKSTQTPAKRKKKATPKKKTKSRKTKKRKVVKRKQTSQPRKRGTSEDKSVQAPAKSKKTTARKAGASTDSVS